MTPEEKAIKWMDEVGKTIAIIDCKKTIEEIELRMDKQGYTIVDLEVLKEYQAILKTLQNTNNK
jgi:hypothetical protein